MKLYKITESKDAIFNGNSGDYTFIHVEGRLKKKGKSSLRMRQMETANFIQGELIDLRNERKANRKNEKKAKKRFY